MKKVLLALAALLVSVTAYAQGQVSFNTFRTGFVDAPVQRPDGSNPGPGISAQLFLVGPGGSLSPLIPTTSFRPAPAPGGTDRQKYVVTTVVDVPGTTPGQSATFRFRAFDGTTYENSNIFGQSPNDVTVVLGGGTLPAATLTGLQGFTLTVVPEPATWALGALALGALALRRRK